MNYSPFHGLCFDFFNSACLTVFSSVLDRSCQMDPSTSPECFKSNRASKVTTSVWRRWTASVRSSVALHASEWQVSTVIHVVKQSKGKSVPLQAWSGPEGSRKLRFQDFMTTAQDGGKVVSLTHRPPLPSGNTPGTHFC